MRAYTPIRERIERWSVPVPESGCWLWLGSIDRCGYGKMCNRRDRESLAHRNSYRAFVGPIPQGLEIDHLCKVRCCVNPLHLQAVTHRENVVRGDAATSPNLYNRRKTYCKRGHELAGENLRVKIYKGKKSRLCLICTRKLTRACYRRWYDKNKTDPDFLRRQAQKVRDRYRAQRKMSA